MLVDYGSDLSDDDTSQQPQQSPSTNPVPTPTKKSTFSLPPPSAGSSSSKPPAPKPKKPTKKIAIELPALPADSDAADDEDSRPSKKPRLDIKGKGASSLFSMLPAPKHKAPVKAVPQRVLGGGKGPGLVFNIGTSRPVEPPTKEEPLEEPEAVDGAEDEARDPPVADPAPSLPFLPPSLAKGRANVSLEEGPSRKPLAKPRVSAPPVSAPAVDFFSLDPGSSSTPNASSRSLLLPKVSSAPKVEEFVPPEPTPADAYPGYYMLPSGTWAAYDTAYYQKFYKKWQADYDAQVRALEKGLEKGFEGANADDTRDVNALREMEKAKKEVHEIEEKKALTLGAAGEPAVPKMNIKGAKLGKGARTRGQLSAMLADAYQNREALEARIAEGKRNRKEAGNKYGF